MTTDLSLRLAEATVPCPGEYHHMPSEHKQGDKPCCLAYSTRAPLPECDAAGRVPWLNGVRVTCDGCYGHADRRQDFCDCNRRGWVVSEDTEAWLEAARPEMLRRGWVLMPLDDIWMVCTVDNCEFVAEAPTVKEALQLALGKVVPK